MELTELRGSGRGHADEAFFDEQVLYLAGKVDLTGIEPRHVMARTEPAHHQVGPANVVDKNLPLALGFEADCLAIVPEAPSCVVHYASCSTIGSRCAYRPARNPAPCRM